MSARPHLPVAGPRVVVRGPAVSLACAAGMLLGGCAAAQAADAPSSAPGTASAADAGSSATPAALQGTWQVLHVAVDRAVAAAGHVPWEPDDARFIGGLRVFDAEGAVDPAPPACRRMAWTPGAPAVLSTLLARDAPPSARAPAPPPADYGLDVGDPMLQPYTGACMSEAGAAAPYDGGHWFALLSDHRLLAGAGPGTVLVLDRITPTTPMRASIDCTQAAGDMQKTICASRRLAGLDLAVAAAYRHALATAHRHSAAAAESLRKSQADWRAAREACGANATCLASSMQSRIDTLMAD